jgi:signal transduction histidine kinase
MICIKASILVIISISIFHIRGITFFGTNLLMFASYYCMGYGSFVNGGGDSPGICWIPVMVAFSGYFLNIRFATMWIVILNLTLFALIKPSLFGMHVTAQLSQSQLTLGRAISTASSGAMMLIFFFNYRTYREKSMIEMSKQKENLEQLNMNLEMSQKELKLQLDNNLRLVRVLSHDLANPLTVIKLGSQRLNQDDPVVKKIVTAAATVEEIIKTVREMQANNDGKNKVRREDVDLEAVIKNVIVLFEEKIISKNVKVVLEVNSERTFVLADKNVVANQIVSNILSNAIKFSKSGDEILFKIESHKGMTVLTVKDRGIGIPKEILEKLFAFDEETSRTGTSGEKGTGFGMPLMKSYLDMMNCSLEVISKTQEEFPSEHGTEFRIYFS